MRRSCGPIFDHCVAYGIDWEYGGAYVEGAYDAPPTITEKQFWQQAEVLVGMLDAYLLFGDEKYWEAFRKVYDFVFAKFVNMPAGGEWYERVDRFGTPIDDALGHALEDQLSYGALDDPDGEAAQADCRCERTVALRPAEGRGGNNA